MLFPPDSQGRTCSIRRCATDDDFASLRVAYVLDSVCGFLIAICGGEIPRRLLHLRLPRKEPIPHAQDKPPGPALSPQEAMRKMVLPPGFTVELVAAEPDLINPVAMTFDERGRIWVTESLEYPRHDAGPGRDRIKVLESTKGDGRFDKITVFADGLEHSLGHRRRHGGVWVANSPDILFLRDTKGTAKPISARWSSPGSAGPTRTRCRTRSPGDPTDVSTVSMACSIEAHIKQHGKEFDFTCAMFRINPRTREFEIFCQGTSNPWGIAWDRKVPRSSALA